MRRSNSRPQIKFQFWKQDGKLWYAEKVDLEAVIRASRHSSEELKRKLGAGYGELLRALDGKRLTGWSVAHIEWGLGQCSESERLASHSWPPNGGTK